MIVRGDSGTSSNSTGDSARGCAIPFVSLCPDESGAVREKLFVRESGWVMIRSRPQIPTGQKISPKPSTNKWEKLKVRFVWFGVRYPWPIAKQVHSGWSNQSSVPGPDRGCTNGIN